MLFVWLALLAADPTAAQGDQDQCRAGRDGFIDLPGLKHPEIEGVSNSGKKLFVDMEETFTEEKVKSIEECEKMCCANVNGHDVECKGYVYYGDEGNHPGQWRCMIIFINFWEHGQRLSTWAEKEGGVKITTKRYREGACKSREISKQTFQDITSENKYGDEGFYVYQVWRKDVKDAKACQALCCELDIFECHGSIFYGTEDPPQWGNCKLLPLDFQFGKYKPSTKEPVISLLADKKCTGGYKQALDYAHPQTKKDVYYDLNDYISADIIKSEADCRAKCCDEKYCTGYAYYMGETFPKAGRCRIYYALFWEGQHHVSMHGKIKSERKMPGVKCEADNKDSWEEVKNAHGENGWFDVEEWFFTGSEDGCKQNCCDYEGFRCGGYSYYPKGRYNPATKQMRPNCKLMLQGFEYTALVLNSQMEEVHTGIYNHYDQCHDEYEEAEIHGDDKNYFWLLSQWAEELDVDKKGCEKACADDDDCTGFRYYGGGARPKYGRCRMSFVKEFWTGRLLFSGFEGIEVMMKTEDGFEAVPGRPQKGYYSTYEWLRVETEEGCRNLCCSFPGFECTAYSFYPKSPTANGDDCKLILNANDNKVKESKADEILHARIKAHLSDQCAPFERERQLFKTIDFIKTDRWFKDVESADACAKKMCEIKGMTYTFYPENPPSWGNCKVFYGDMRKGAQRPSSKQGLVHGMLNGDAANCKITSVTKHKIGDAAKGIFSAFMWRTVNNEKECQEHCCKNTVQFAEGCGAYSYYRPDDRKTNCKLIAKGFVAVSPRVKSVVGQEWIIHGIVPGEDKKPEKKDEDGNDVCGNFLKKIKFKGSKKVTKDANDACSCENACSDAPAWEFDPKKSSCTCHERKNPNRGINVSKVKPTKKAAKAKVIASTNEKGEL